MTRRSAHGQKHEEWCRLYFDTGKAIQSYLDVFGCALETAREGQRRLRKCAECIARLTELREKAEEQVLHSKATSREEIRARLWENYQMAREEKDLKASTHALYLCGKDIGMFQDRVLHGDLDRELAGMSEEALLGKIRMLLVEILPPQVRDGVLYAFDQYASGGGQVPRVGANEPALDVQALPETAGVS